MKDRRSFFSFACQAVALRRLALIFVIVTAVDARTAEEPLAASTIVVYNKVVPDSVELAKFYAQQRGIARDHLVGLTCSTEEEISREDYDATIADPLREIFKARQWWTIRETPEHTQAVLKTSIRFVAVIKGVPLKIRPANQYPGDEVGPGPVNNRNEASVDSELAVLGFFTKHVAGPMLNPYFQNFRSIGELENAALLLVCRLDAPATATVRRMIVDAIAAEKNGLWGRAYVDGADNLAAGFEVGERWLADIPPQLHKVGVPVVYDDLPAIFPDGYPMTDCALYYGWYAGNIAGPFLQPEFHFVPGAIAVHIHSFSANTLRDPNANWVGPLVTRGAAASVGNVYEPFLQLTAHLNILNDRLLHGFTLAESAYASIEALSWMSVIVGDPLYRPYAGWLQLDLSPDFAKGAANWRMYHDFAVKNVTKPAPEYRMLARQVASRACNGAMIEDLGLMEVGDGNFSVATSYFQQARTCYTARDDILRVVLEEADAWAKQKKPKRALELVRSTLRIVSDAPAAALLRKMERELKASSTSRAKP
jgi:uncharacterized protein (TIGR03790 family)